MNQRKQKESPRKKSLRGQAKSSLLAEAPGQYAHNGVVEESVWRSPASIDPPNFLVPRPIQYAMAGKLEFEEWDYSATEWWGWVILITTWVCFVIVMGSCLGIWSWAWDVGETPYAPPELEDDSTLPIVGYYPALMVLTAIMSWVWVIVAWLGLKYFKHARVQGDDG